MHPDTALETLLKQNVNGSPRSSMSAASTRTSSPTLGHRSVTMTGKPWGMPQVTSNSNADSAPAVESSPWGVPLKLRVSGFELQYGTSQPVPTPRMQQAVSKEHSVGAALRTQSVQAHIQLHGSKPWGFSDSEKPRESLVMPWGMPSTSMSTAPTCISSPIDEHRSVMTGKPWGVPYTTAKSCAHSAPVAKSEPWGVPHELDAAVISLQYGTPQPVSTPAMQQQQAATTGSCTTAYTQSVQEHIQLCGSKPWGLSVAQKVQESWRMPWGMPCNTIHAGAGTLRAALCA